MVFGNITSMFDRVFQPIQSKTVVPVKNNVNKNPFASPFFTGQENSNSNYAKNKPVSGGYYAGYYNGKPNIVGTRLFLEV